MIFSRLAHLILSYPERARPFVELVRSLCPLRYPPTAHTAGRAAAAAAEAEAEEEAEAAAEAVAEEEELLLGCI